MERVEASLRGDEKQLESIGGNLYQGSMMAPVPKTESAVYPVIVTAIGDNGGQTQESRDLLVQGSGIFPLKFKIHLLLIGRRSFISLVCIGTSNRGRLQSILLPSDFIYKSMPPKLSLKISLSALLDRSYWSLSRCFY